MKKKKAMKAMKAAAPAAAMKAMKAMKKKAAMKAMKAMKKKAAMKAMKAMAAMKAMKAMKKKAAMKAMKAAAPAPAMKAMKAMKKKKAMKAMKAAAPAPAAHEGVLREAPAHAQVEVRPRLGPRHHVADDALGHHAPRPVVQVGELMRDLHVEREQSGLALGDLLAERVGLRLGEGALSDLELGGELLQLGVLPVHGLDQVGLAELDVADARRLEDAAARVLVGVHLHHGLVDRGVDDDPRAAAQLAVRRDVHEDRLLVVAQVVDDEGAELEDLAVHVTRAAREAAPVGEDHHGQVLAREVVDGLRRLVGRVGVPHL